jgi:hypothetical protein
MVTMKSGSSSVEDARAIAGSIEIVTGRRGREPLVVVFVIAEAANALLRLGQRAVDGKYSDRGSIRAGRQRTPWRNDRRTGEG